MDTRPKVVAVCAALVIGAVLMVVEDRVTVLLAGALRTLTTAWHSDGPKKPKSTLYSSAASGALRICFSIGGQHFCSMARMCPAAVLSVLLIDVPSRCGSMRSEMNLSRGMINTFITSPPNSDRPAIEPYSDDRCVLSF